jgi:hypothetical protein
MSPAPAGNATPVFHHESHTLSESHVLRRPVREARQEDCVPAVLLADLGHNVPASCIKQSMIITENVSTLQK